MSQWPLTKPTLNANVNFFLGLSRLLYLKVKAQEAGYSRFLVLIREQFCGHSYMKLKY